MKPGVEPAVLPQSNAWWYIVAMLKRVRSRQWASVPISSSICVTLTLGVALMTAPGSTARAESVALDRIVAVVGDDIILASELEDELLVSPLVLGALQALGPNPSEAKVRDTQLQQRPAVLDAMIDDRLVLAETARYPSTVLTEEELRGYLENIARSNQIGSVDELRKLVSETEEYGSWDHYKGTIRRQAAVFKVEQMLVPASPVTDARVLAYYRTMRAREVATAEVERFVFPAAAAPRLEALLGSEAGAVDNRDEQLRDLAFELEIEGEARELEQGKSPAELDGAVFASEAGAVVGPFASDAGLEVYVVDEVDKAEIVAFEQAKDRLRMQLEEKERRDAVANFREELRIRAHIDIRL